MSELQEATDMIAEKVREQLEAEEANWDSLARDLSGYPLARGRFNKRTGELSVIFPTGVKS